MTDNNSDPVKPKKSDSSKNRLLRSLRASKDELIDILTTPTEEGEGRNESTTTQETVTAADDRYETVEMTADQQLPDEYSATLSNKINFLEQQIITNQALAEKLEREKAKLAQDEKLCEFLNTLSVELVEYMNKQPIPVVSQTREQFMIGVRQQFYDFLNENSGLKGEASEKSIAFLLKEIENKYTNIQKVMLEYGFGKMTQILKIELNECLEKMKKLQLNSEANPVDDSKEDTSEEAGPSGLNQ